MTESIATLLILAMVAIMAAKTLPVIRAEVPGNQELVLSVPLLFRLLAQRVNILCILIVLILGSGIIGDRWIPRGMFFFALIAIAGLVTFPIRYRFTSAGISPNASAFRPWADFERWQSSGNLVMLQGKGRLRSLKLYVTNQDRDQVFKVLRRHVKAGA